MSRRNGQHLPAGSGAGTLYIVATPLGNLQDLSQRARDTLAAVDAVLCEDTRHTLKLMAHLGLQKPLERLDQHAGEGRLASVADQLQEGKSFALVSDAGTPAISDPGAALVAECHRRGVRVVPVPGPSAGVALLSVAGFLATEFAFLGFAPRAEKDLRAQVERLRGIRDVRTWVWFESPHRVVELLRVLADALPNSRATAGKELTKLHEALYHGHLKTVSADVSAHVQEEGERGEWVVAVEIADEDLSPEPSREEEVKRTLKLLIDAGVSASRAAREVSQSFGVKRNFVYDLALAIENEKKDENELKKT